MNLTIRFNTNASEVSDELLRLFRDQLPFAMPLTLNAIGKDVRDEQRPHGA